ncbi:AAA family ATPase [Thermosediminibacter litoriperuensis]|uniref:Nuclease SbcCD subunit C n=1 Tax=Thermosediminibacter litoriperuensis TaxID=291989 RepID=A0A5S5AQM2_9FIRM|nr:AAA family ATPase [Thermosediminibacter litoriperuensis]TYP54317.1 AAA domain-containing protein [Thermosediminibacter litoriperuensis]
MGYIKKIKLINFQSHKDTEITFDEGLTVILGPTDQGKSAIIRALKWVLYNEPRGTDFISVGSNFCRVSVEMDDGTVIIRERGNNRNRYILIKDGKEQIFEGFGNTVPLEIVRAHGIPKIYLDKDSNCAVNLSEQLEGPFLISENAGIRAKVLGRLIGIHIIDAAQRSTIRDLADAEQRNKALAIELEEIKTKLKEYEDLPLVEKKINSLQKILGTLKEKKHLYKKLTGIRELLMSSDNEIKAIKETLKKLESVSDAEGALEKIEYAIKVKIHLVDCRTRLQSVEREMKKEKKNIEKTANLEEAVLCYQRASALFGDLVKLKLWREKLVEVDAEISANKKVFTETKDVPQAVTLISALEVLNTKLAELNRIKDRENRVKSQINLINRELQRYKYIGEVDSSLNEITHLHSRLSSLKSLKQSLKDVESLISRGQTYLDQNYKELVFFASSYAVLLRRLSKCPTCMNPIDDSRAEKIAAEILKSGG